MSLWETAKLAGCGCSPIGCGALARAGSGSWSSSGGGGLLICVLIQLDVPFLSLPNMRTGNAGSPNRGAVAWGSLLPMQPALRPCGERLPLCSGLCRQDGAENVPFPGRWGRVWGCGGSYSGALARAEAQRVQFVLSDVAAYILAWAMGLSSSAGILPAPSHHARLPEARGRGLDMREGRACLCALMARSPRVAVLPRCPLRYGS